MFIAIAAAALVLAGEPRYFGNDYRGCQAAPDLAWCAGRAEDGKAINTEVIADYAQRVEKTLEYRPNVGGGQETWRSFYADASQGKRWKGDCDNFVYTALDWLDHDGYDIRQTYRLAVSTDGDEFVDHLVAVARIDGIDYVFADGTRRGVYPLAKAKWRAILAAPATSKEWREVNIR